MQYSQVYIPGTPENYTWHTKNLKTQIGDRVLVDFRNYKRIGIVLDISPNAPEKFSTKPILKIIEEKFIPEKYIRLAQEIATENFCKIQDVLPLMIPEKFCQKITPENREIFYTIKKSPHDSLELGGDLEGVIQNFQISARAKKQIAIIQALLNQEKISEKQLERIASKAILKNLEKKGAIQKICGKVFPGFSPPKVSRKNNHTLTPAQQKVFEEIISQEKPSLLWGVTGSGKTEIYKKIAKYYLQKNPPAQILFLLPEIALTPQLIAEFYHVFGDIIAVWHSKCNEGQKIQEYARIKSGDAKIIIGARSAIMLPMPNLRCIIMDEEHEWTYKNEFSPRYSTHDIAEKLNVKLLLGSATPSLESFHKADQGQYHQVNLLERVNQTTLPKIQKIDLRQEQKKGNYAPISQALHQSIQETLEKKQQIVLFLNKRGYAGGTYCKSCGKPIDCPSCDQPLKVHRFRGENEVKARLCCHYCGHMESYPKSCPHCGEEDFEVKGYGTQQLEEILKKNYPTAKVIRADADTTSRKGSFEQVMHDFQNHKADILLGTQMIAKGLDFEKVSLVGIILADTGLHLPDIRSEERIFQLLTQVSGRAGRKNIPGKIILQTYNPEHEVFDFVQNYDTKGFIENQKNTREKTAMPPYSHIAKITISHEDKAIAHTQSQKSFQQLKAKISECVSPLPQGEVGRGVEEITLAPAFFPKIHNKYHFHIFLKAKTKNQIQQFLKKHQDLLPEKARIDMTPMTLL